MNRFITLISFVLFFPIGAHALSPDEIKSAIYQKMRDHHPTPDPTFWNNLGPDSVPVMESMLKASTSPLEQSWLLDGLSHFSDPSIAPILENGIENSDNAVTQKKMLTALINSQGDASLDFVEPYLKDKDPHIRLAVAEGLQNQLSANAKAQASLVAFNATEKEAWVKKDLQKSASDGSAQKRSGSALDADPAPKPLLEKDWAGEWRGVWISAKRSSSAKLNLTRLEKDKSWKGVLELPKQSAYELKHDGMEVLYYTSSHLHWIELRNKKDDSVFIGQRKP